MVVGSPVCFCDGASIVQLFLTCFNPRKPLVRIFVALAGILLCYLWLRSEIPATDFSSLAESKEQPQQQQQQPQQLQSLEEQLQHPQSSCVFPPFVLQLDQIRGAKFLALQRGENDDEEENEGDPTFRARVGPSPQHGPDANYTVIYNFLSPVSGGEADDQAYRQERQKEEEKEEDGEESVTLVTHATPEFLFLHLPRLLRHWPAPHRVSVAVYAPGEDFCLAQALLSWLWRCSEDGLEVRRRASFHVFFRGADATDVALKTAAQESGGVALLEVDCSTKPALQETFVLLRYYILIHSTQV